MPPPSGTAMEMPADLATLLRAASPSRPASSSTACPSRVALGLTIAEGEVGVALLAGILVGQPDGVLWRCPADHRRWAPSGFAIRLLGGIGLLLALATVLGGTVLADASPELIGTAQAIAAGAVLAVITIAVVPHAFEEVSRLTAVTTVAGFLLGYVLSSDPACRR